MPHTRNRKWATSVFLNMLENTIKQRHKDPDFPNSTYDQYNIYEASRALSFILQLWKVAHCLEAPPLTYCHHVSNRWQLFVARARHGGLRRTSLQEHDERDQRRLWRRSHSSVELRRKAVFLRTQQRWLELRMKTLVCSRNANQNCREQEMCWMEDKRQPEGRRQADGCGLLQSLRLNPCCYKCDFIEEKAEAQDSERHCDLPCVAGI